MTVSGTITIPRGSTGTNTLAVGAGTLNAGSIAFTNGGAGQRHYLTISTGTAKVTGDVTETGSTGSATITFTGTGTLNLGGGLFTSGTGTLTTYAGSTVNYDGAGAQTVQTFAYANLTISGSGTKTLAAATPTVNGALTVNAGATLALLTYALGATTAPTSVILQCGAITGSSITGTTGSLRLGGDVTVTSAGTGSSGATISSLVVLTAARTFTVADDGTTATDLSISGVISGAYGITKAGAGAMELSGLNTYTGTTTVSAGILRATNNTVVVSTAGPFGNNASGLYLAGGTIQSNVATFSRPLTITVTNSGLDAYGSARTISSTLTFATAGTFNLNVGGTTATGAEGQNLTLSGIIRNSSGTLGLTKIGSSTVILSAVNTYTGATTITAGILTLNPSGNTTNATPFVLNGGTLSTSGITANRTITASTLNLAATSNIVLNNNVHSLTFANSSGVSWTTGTLLTITGWQGLYNGTAGTAGRIYLSATAGLTSNQLKQIQFYNGTTYFPAMLLTGGELVPFANYLTTGTVSGSPFCAGVTGITVPFTYRSISYFTGATFTAQLSSAAGSFATPVTLQSVTFDGSGSQSISVTIPSGTAYGTGYRIRVVSTTPTVTGTDNGVNLTINTLPTPTFTVAPGANTCASTSVTYTTQASQSSYVWTVPGTLGTDYTITSGGISGTDYTVTLTWLTTGSKTVTVNYNNSNGCTGANAASNTMTVNPLPTPTIMGSMDSLYLFIRVSLFNREWNDKLFLVGFFRRYDRIRRHVH